MKILTLLSCGTALLGLLCYAQEERDPFAEPQEPLPKPEIPERGVLKLPQSVTHKRLDNGHHEYRVVGLYASDKGRDPADSASYCASTFGYLLPEGAQVEAELKDGSLVIRTSVQIHYDTLAFAIDGVAAGGGEIPTWVELEARDLKKSELFDPNHYQVVKLEIDFPAGLAWLGMSRTEGLRLPFVTKFWSTGTLLVGPTTGRCMCHSRFAIRILHEDGSLIWEDSDSAYGNVQVAMADTDGDRIHEVYFETDDHGKNTRYVLKPQSEQAGADQPATAPESKPEGKENPKPESEAAPR